MPLFNQPNYCPNTNCPNDKTLKSGEKCPDCGSDAKPFGFKDGNDLRMSKKNASKIAKKIEQGSKDILFSDNMTDADIRKKINEDMINLSSHEAGTGWMRLGTLISGNSTDQILGAGLKAVIDQNKILIRQNELLLRVLSQQKQQ